MALYYPAPKLGLTEIRDRRYDKNIQYWRRLQQHSVFCEPNHVTSVAISPRSPYQAACTSSVRLTMYDTQWCQQVTQFSRFKKAVFGATFRHDGELIGIGGEEGKLRIFDAVRTTGRQKVPLRVARGGNCALHTVRFSASGQNVFSMADDGVIKKFDIAVSNAEAVVSFKAHEDVIRCGIASSLNENVVISGSYDHKIKLWDLRTDPTKTTPMVLNAGAPVENLLFLPSENLLVTAGSNVVKIWDLLGGGRLLTNLQAHHKTVTSLCINGRGDYFLSGAIDRKINVIRVSDFTISHSLTVAAPILGLAISPDDQTMAIAMGDLLSIYKRAPEKTNVVSLDTTNQKSIVRSNVPTVSVQMHGSSKEIVKVSAKPPDRLYLSKFDQMLKAYKHHDLVGTLFSNPALWADAGMVVGFLRVLTFRGALQAAFAGQKPMRQVSICKFLTRNLFLVPYFDTLMNVTEAVFEVFSLEELDDKVMLQLNRLKEAVEREFTVQKQMSQMVGELEFVINSANVGHKKSPTRSTDSNVFGEPIISSVRMNLLDTTA